MPQVNGFHNLVLLLGTHHGPWLAHSVVQISSRVSLFSAPCVDPPCYLPFPCLAPRAIFRSVQGESICRDALTAATANKNLDELNLNLQKASEMGLSGPEVDRAKAVQKELHVSHASLKALRCVCVFFFIICIDGANRLLLKAVHGLGPREGESWDGLSVRTSGPLKIRRFSIASWTHICGYGCLCFVRRRI